MTRRWVWMRWWVAIAWLGAVSLNGAWAQPAVAPAFEVQIDAPPPLDAFLTQHMDVQRFRDISDLTPSELERLVAQIPGNVTDLLSTRGFFSPTVDASIATRPDQTPLVTVRVVPGDPVRVASRQITLDGAARDDPLASGQRARIVSEWALPVGDTFSQAAWEAAKTQALRTLNRQRYPRARLVNSLADIARAQQQAHLYVEFDSGPATAFGPIRVEGADRYDPDMARRLAQLAGIRPGVAYDETLLQQAQQRLVASGYYPSAFVALAPEGDPAAHEVVVRVREVPLQKLAVGVGASTDRGPRLTLEHTHHQLPGLGWRSVSRLRAEQEASQVSMGLTAPIDDKGWQEMASGLWSREVDGLRTTTTQQVRVGQTQAALTMDRGFFLQWDRSRIQGPRLEGQPEQATALSGHYTWIRRRLDDMTSPRQGYALGIELGAGVTLSQSRDPYTRAHVRWLGYAPIASGSERPSRLALRAEAGAIWSPVDAPVPVSQRFLTGGDGSVRGYGLNDIGVDIPGGGTEAGLVLGVASVEWQRPLWRGAIKTAWEQTVFVDVGAVGNDTAALSPKVGVGAGVRYNSPVGPLQADLAYGVDTRRWRIHLNVGFTF